MKEYLKPSEYAKTVGLHHITVVEHFDKGYIGGYKDENTGSIFIKNPAFEKKDKRGYGNCHILTRATNQEI